MLVPLGAWQLFIIESVFGPPQNRVNFFSWPGSLEEAETGWLQMGQCQPDKLDKDDYIQHETTFEHYRPQDSKKKTSISCGYWASMRL